MSHGAHTDIVKRLRRIEGHLRSVIAMIEDGRSCVDLAQQLHAVEAAVTSAKRELIHAHLETCFDGDDADKADLKEIKQLAKYL